MAHRDVRGAAVPQREPGQISLHRLIQPEPSGLDLLHHRNGREGLAGGGEQYRCLGCHRPPRLIGVAERGGVHLLAVLHDGDRGTGQTHGADPLLQESVHLFIGLVRDGGSGRGLAGRGCGLGNEAESRSYSQEAGRKPARRRRTDSHTRTCTSADVSSR